MKKPTRQDTINLRIRRSTGMERIESIVGVVEYPLAIHRSITEHEQITEGVRKRYSGVWSVTHIPTGKSFGIRSTDWNKVMQYVEGVKDHPALLMMTDETMSAHPMFQELNDLHSRLRRELF